MLQNVNVSKADKLFGYLDLLYYQIAITKDNGNQLIASQVTMSFEQIHLQIILQWMQYNFSNAMGSVWILVMLAFTSYGLMWFICQWVYELR